MLRFKTSNHHPTHLIRFYIHRVTVSSSVLLIQTLIATHNSRRDCNRFITHYSLPGLRRA